MANAYANEVTSSESTTEQTRIIRCNVATQLNAGDTITVVATNSVAVCFDIIAFNHVATGAAANTQTGSNAGNTSPTPGSALTSTTAGDIALGAFCAGNSPTVSSLRDNLGNTMTQVGSTQAGQSRTSAAMWLVEAGSVLPKPQATLGSSQAWAAVAARYNNDGSTITKIASSDTSSGWTADPGNKTFTVTVPAGVTIPSGATLFLFVNAAGNTGALTISDNAGGGGGGAPVNTVAPAVTGTAQVGSTLTSDHGTFTGDVSSGYAYQWQRDVAGNGTFSNISGATSTTYVLVDADDGNKVRCVVTATGTGGSTSANSNAAGLVAEPAPSNTVAPAVTGTAQVGSTLTTTNGTWTGMGGVTATFAYQWRRDVAGNGTYSDISGATSTTYVLVDADDGCHVRCVVTATNDTSGVPATSNTVGLITEPAPVNTVAPAVTGTAQVGSTLTTTDGTWSHMGGLSPSFTYQWRRDNFGGGTYSDISGATASTYVLVDADDACELECVVTAHNTNATATPATSNTFGTITEPAPVNTVLPAITGTVRVGQTLTCSDGTWDNMGGHAASFTFQWRSSADGSTGWTDIAGATNSTYVPVTGDIGLFFDVVLTAHNTGSA